MTEALLREVAALTETYIVRVNQKIDFVCTDIQSDYSVKAHLHANARMS